MKYYHSEIVKIIELQSDDGMIKIFLEFFKVENFNLKQKKIYRNVKTQFNCLKLAEVWPHLCVFIDNSKNLKKLFE